MQNSKLFIPILLATGRNERQSEKVANYTLKQMQAFGFDTQIVDVRDHMQNRTIPNWQDPVPSKGWSEIMNRADGLIIVSPEYNHSFPGEFKIVFDQLFDEYKKKPVSICAVSDGDLGGARLIEQLWIVVLAAGMVPTSQAVRFAKVKELFDPSGVMLDRKFEKRMRKMMEETEWYARALKVARERN